MIATIRRNKLITVVALTYLSLGIFQPEKATRAISNSAYYLLEMVQIMPVIFLLTVAIAVLVPKEWILNHLGEDSGKQGSLLALLLGSVSAGPIYAAFPIGKMLVNKGASTGNVVIILSAWAVVKVPMLATEAKFLGIQFMLVRWTLTVLMIFLMGFLIQRFVPKEVLPTDKRDFGVTSRVLEDYCLGCGLCVNLFPDLFEIEGGKARMIAVGNFSEQTGKIKKMAGECPANAIWLKSEKEEEIC